MKLNVIYGKYHNSANGNVSVKGYAKFKKSWCYYVHPTCINMYTPPNKQPSVRSVLVLLMENML